MTLRLWTSALLALAGLLGLAAVAGYLTFPLVADSILPAGVPAGFVNTFLAADLVFFVAVPLWAAGGLARARPHGFVGLALHAGAACYVALWAWGVVVRSGDGLALALALTPELLVLPPLVIALRPGGARDTRPVRAPDRTTAPGEFVALFDGNCSFCRAGAARLEHWAGSERVTLLSLHDPDAARRFPDLPHEALMRALHLVLPDGRVVEGAEAVLHAAAVRPGFRALLGLYRIPGLRALIDVGYALFAGNRYALTGGPCAGGACRVEPR